MDELFFKNLALPIPFIKLFFKLFVLRLNAGDQVGVVTGPVHFFLELPVELFGILAALAGEHFDFGPVLVHILPHLV